ncbi:MAG: bifunctional riboflavin kinase/FAD synthetase [bacterium]
MKFINDLDGLSGEIGTASALTLGCFDGIHLGHRAILERVAAAPAREGCAARVVVTFEPHPALVLEKGRKNFLLTTREEKEALLSGYGLDFACFVPFTVEFARTPAAEFIETTLAGRLKARRVVVGADIRFGHRREGSVPLLEEAGRRFGFEVEVVERVEAEGEAVSSTRIRALLEGGEVEAAAGLLGRDYVVTGEVVRGAGLGARLGIPTANIMTGPFKLIPGSGVYAVRAGIEGGGSPGVMNIGVRPTVGGGETTLEVHLMDFRGEIYGKRVTVSFVKRLRDEKKFPSLEKLKRQITRDMGIAEKILRR